jgi:aspartate aminotransferase
LAADLLFGEGAYLEESSCSIQTISGTGANHLGALFLAQHLKPNTVWISYPTWSNHHLIWEVGAPLVRRKTYPYYKAQDRSFDIDGMLSTLETEIVENDVIIINAYAHNPTGLDATQDQWRDIAALATRKKLFVFFDAAYQGFAFGDPDKDAWAVRYFHKAFLSVGKGGPAGLCVAQSFAKTFGLYGERAGAFHLILPSGSASAGAQSHLLRLVRAEISNPPLFGARIVHAILSMPELRTQWKKDLETMSDRIRQMRHLLRKQIEAHPDVGDWSHLESQISMFSYTGLSTQQVARLRAEHHISLMSNGQASLSGVSPTNVTYVAEAFVEVVRWARVADSQHQSEVRSISALH